MPSFKFLSILFLLVAVHSVRAERCEKVIVPTDQQKSWAVPQPTQQFYYYKENEKVRVFAGLILPNNDRKPRVLVATGYSEMPRIESVSSGHTIEVLYGAYSRTQMRLSPIFICDLVGNADRSIVIGTPGEDYAPVFSTKCNGVVRGLPGSGKVHEAKFIRKDLLVTLGGLNGSSMSFWQVSSKQTPELREKVYFNQYWPDRLTVRDFAIAPGGKKMAIAFDNDEIGIYSINQLLRTNRNHSTKPEVGIEIPGIQSLAYSEDGQSILTTAEVPSGPKTDPNASQSVGVKVLSSENLKLQARKQLGVLLSGEQYGQNKVFGFSENKIAIVLGGQNSRLFILDEKAQILLNVGIEPKIEISAVAADPKRQLLIVGTNSGQITIADALNLRQMSWVPKVNDLPIGTIEGIDISLDGKYVSIGSSEGHLLVYETKSFFLESE